MKEEPEEVVSALSMANSIIRSKVVVFLMIAISFYESNFSIILISIVAIILTIYTLADKKKSDFKTSLNEECEHFIKSMIATTFLTLPIFYILFCFNSS